jgi:hypothetical protein
MEMVRDAAAEALNRIAPPLTCRVTVDKTVTEIGGFVTATVQLTNTSAQPLLVLSLEPDVKRQDAGLFVAARAEGYSSRFPEPDPGGVKPYEYRQEDFVELASGKTIERRIPVGWAWMVAAGISAKPGVYTLVGKYVMPEIAPDVWHGEVVSTPVVVRIKTGRAGGIVPADDADERMSLPKHETSIRGQATPKTQGLPSAIHRQDVLPRKVQ